MILLELFFNNISIFYFFLALKVRHRSFKRELYFTFRSRNRIYLLGRGKLKNPSFDKDEKNMEPEGSANTNVGSSE